MSARMIVDAACPWWSAHRFSAEIMWRSVSRAIEQLRSEGYEGKPRVSLNHDDRLGWVVVVGHHGHG